MKRTVAIIQARMGATRLPGKVLKPLAGQAALHYVVRAARQIKGIDEVVVATSSAVADDAVAEWCRAAKVEVFRGSEQDVLSRFAGAAKAARADVVMRLTADCPLLDPTVCAAVLTTLRRGGFDYVNNIDPPSYPDGLDCEAFTADCLLTADREASLPSEREHVTPFIRSRSHRFRLSSIACPIPNLEQLRWTLDDPADHAFLEAVLGRLPKDKVPLLCDVLALLDAVEGISDINRSTERDMGMRKSLAAERTQLAPVFTESASLYQRALKTVPLASQTFSKSAVQYPDGYAPLFLARGKGGLVWDVDGNRFVDMVSGLLCVGLGYGDPDVDFAVRDQLRRGASFSLPTSLEHEVAETLCEVIPCAEMVRFGKNGSDVTAAAVRIARAFTGREHVLVCGYHGWQDWYIGSTTRHLGVPQAVRAMTHTVPFADLGAVEAKLRELDGKVAALVMEPVNVTVPPEGYYGELKALLHRHGALLVFDEIITGFRVHLGGAQAHFGVTPDLACFGKALGNGLPLSAIAGRRDIMALMTEIFFSGTFGGEALSLAAAKAVLAKMQREPVIEELWRKGQQLADAVGERISQHGLDGVIALKGLAPWKILAISDHPNAEQAVVRTWVQKHMIRHGVLLLGSHNVCYAHTPEDLDHVIWAWEQTLAGLARELERPGLADRLGCKPIRPVFRTR